MGRSGPPLKLIFFDGTWFEENLFLIISEHKDI